MTRNALLENAYIRILLYSLARIAAAFADGAIFGGYLQSNNFSAGDLPAHAQRLLDCLCSFSRMQQQKSKPALDFVLRLQAQLLLTTTSFHRMLVQKMHWYCLSTVGYLNV